MPGPIDGLSIYHIIREPRWLQTPHHIRPLICNPALSKDVRVLAIRSKPTAQGTFLAWGVLRGN